MTMASSLEARMPFLDVKLAAYMANAPTHFRIRGKTTKCVLREGARSLIPKTIIDRPKAGFKLPVHEWFRTGLHSQVESAILSETSRIAPMLQRSKAKRIVTEHWGRTRNHEKLIWSLLSLEAFLNAYDMEL